MDKAKEALFEAIETSLKTANISQKEVNGITLGMAGVDRPADVALVTEWMRNYFPSTTKIQVYNDGIVALASGTLGVLHGVVVISGTGMISIGFNKNKNIGPIRAGGLGPLLGDEGSGYAIGIDLLRAASMAHDKRGPPTKLHEGVLQHLQLKDATELIDWAYRDLSWARIANLAQVAYAAYNDGDEEAKKILNHAANSLANTITTVIKGLEFTKEDTFSLVFAGGNLTHKDSILAMLLKQQMLSSYPHAQIKFPEVDPEMAAALLSAHG